ncbi:MAG TPA: hypothetical protein VJM34_18385 [Novosphingobium sp.]|nr:hypothetical protein [Novosphingobium sp.]
MNATADLLPAEPRLVTKLPPSKALRLTWLITFGSLVAAGSVYSSLALQPGADRKLIAQILNSHTVIVYYVGVFAAMWLPSLRKWTAYERLQGVVLPFLIMSYVVQLTWELGFVLLNEQIANARNESWAYTWWSYLDGGDYRYLNPEAPILTMEILGITNAVVGIFGLIYLQRSRFADYRATLIIMAVEAIQIPLTWYYYLSEALDGFSHVNTNSFMDFGVTFFLVNSPWLIVPWMVLYWGNQTLLRQFAVAANLRASAGGAT